MSKRTAIALTIAIAGLTLGLFSERIGRLLPAPDIAPLQPGTMFKNLCFRWDPPECFRERLSTDWLRR